ncbi:transcriptional regulator [Caulobacter sp. AP07]|uniref:MarR family winged helix-turn-helix transcriptional regulator n=1 Tax=Caulobacter sp. AP07 TaxID=1144304 RepID=UPI0002720744|nr:MarR family transcriptional regulator [Caulobacter sp. AP07]EJL25199.1 transcriptional regulator [Caulobacter sp. AP07]
MTKASTPPQDASRETLLARLNTAVREASAQGVLISQAVADIMGVSTTDLECLDLILLHGPRTAGDLTRATGLTSGAVTGLIDRLERAGYVARESDPNDRRRVVVRAIPENMAWLMALYDPLQAASEQLYAGYSDAELALIVGFMDRNVEMAQVFIAGLKAREG